MDKITITGRPANGSTAVGEALVCPRSIMGWNGVDLKTGEITEKGHLHEGVSVKGKVLVIPGSSGSVAWSDSFYACHLNDCGPVAYVLTQMDSKVGTTVLVSDIPCVTDFPDGTDPCTIIETGDQVIVDGDKGTVEIVKK